MVTENMASRTNSWQASSKKSLRNHIYIIFEIDLKKKAGLKLQKQRGCQVVKFNQQKLKSSSELRKRQRISLVH